MAICQKIYNYVYWVKKCWKNSKIKFHTENDFYTLFFSCAFQTIDFQKHRLRDEFFELSPCSCSSSSYSSPIERSFRFLGFAFWLPLFRWLDPFELPPIDGILASSPLKVLRVIDVACWITQKNVFQFFISILNSSCLRSSLLNILWKIQSKFTCDKISSPLRSLFFKLPAQKPDEQLFAANAAFTLYTNWASVSRNGGINAMIAVSLMAYNFKFIFVSTNWQFFE